MGLFILGSPGAKPTRTICPRALGALLLFAGLSACVVAVAQPSPSATSSASKEAAKGELALARMLDLGANVISDEVGENGERQIVIDFSTRPVVAVKRGGEHGSVPPKWMGDDSDFRWLEKIAALGELHLVIDFQHISPQVFSRLRPRHRFGEIFLREFSNQTVEQLERLPSCRRLVVPCWGLTPTSLRRLAVLAAEVESLAVHGHGPGPQLGVSDADLAELAGLDNLAELEIVNSAVTPAGFKHMAGMKRLHHLLLLCCPGLNQSDLAGLDDLAALRILHINQQVSAAGLANIGKLNALEELHMGMADLEPEEAAPLAELNHLRILSMGPTETRPEKVPLGDAIAAAAAKATNLQSLTLKKTMSNKGLEAIAALPNLQTLMIHLNEVDDRSLALVGRLTGLRRLHLEGKGNLSDAGIAHLKGLTELVDLSLPGTGITDAGLASLAEMTAMKQLSLQGSSITGTGLAALDRWKSLQFLNLGNSPFSDEGCRLLPQFAQLETLHLFSTRITDGGLESVATLRNLSKLDVNNDRPISDVGLANLKSLEQLLSLRAVNTTVSQDGIDKLQSSLRDLEVEAGVGLQGGIMKVRAQRTRKLPTAKASPPADDAQGGDIN